MATVEILLAAHNSSRFLDDAIRSIISQNYTDWRLLIRDDGSTDNTLNIIDRYVEMYPGKIVSIDSDRPATACENFSKLLEISIAPYIMFADHDDVWLPFKISRSMELMQNAENESGANTPLLLFTDKKVVDADLREISPSYFKYQNLNPKYIALNRLLVQNVGSGCTILLNRALCTVCGTIPSEAFMHDHWLMLIAAAMGKIIYLNEPTIMYRQHGNNSIGASGHGISHFYSNYLNGFDAARSRLSEYVRQAKAFGEVYSSRLKPEDYELINEFASLNEQSWFARRKTLIKNGILKTGLIRNMAMMAIA